ncbi:MAG: zinc ribbon domain-containing protein [Deltaproteobacteria bacterium]|nr:zinc ribbon domain-containing protein [Deltaproteobacteria bacterium]
MPIYEYKCQKCGKEFDVFQKITDPAVTSCKFCKGRVSKLISLSSFHLKGSGWYVTDYGGKKTNQTDTKKEETSTAAKEESVKTEAAGKSDTE